MGWNKLHIINYTTIDSRLISRQPANNDGSTASGFLFTHLIFLVDLWGGANLCGTDGRGDRRPCAYYNQNHTPCIVGRPGQLFTLTVSTVPARTRLSYKNRGCINQTFELWTWRTFSLIVVTSPLNVNNRQGPSRMFETFLPSPSWPVVNSGCQERALGDGGTVKRPPPRCWMRSIMLTTNFGLSLACNYLVLTGV